MIVSLNWLSSHIDLEGLDAERIAELLTFAGVEVEGIENRGVKDPHVVVARVLEASPHPQADRLKVCQVDAGTGTPRQIVCGATNYREGDLVPLALPGAVLPGGFEIKEGKLRGVVSGGMMCSARELGLGNDHEGLMILDGEAPVGTPLAEYLGSDVCLEIEITPNRPDLLGHYGLARELSALTGRALKSGLPAPQAVEQAPDSLLGITMPETCPFYVLQKITGVKVGSSPQWLRQRLESVGLRPINNIVDITNFVLLDTGHPLHAFDAAKLDGTRLIVRAAKPGETIAALDDCDYTLTEEDCVIADASAPQAIAGVMGGAVSGVTETTTDVFLESAWFLPTAVRRTSRRLALSSDSSYRFERGADPGMVTRASALATRLILECAGGQADGPCLSAGEVPQLTGTVSYDPESAGVFLGGHLDAAAQIETLERLGMQREAENGTAWRIPTFRADLQRPVDLIEEVARVRGLAAVPPRTSAAPASASDADRLHDFTLDLKKRLVALGFSEARTLKLVSAAEAEVAPGDATAVALRNPLGEEHTHLRPSLLPGLLGTLERNLNQGQNQLLFFEVGTVFETAVDGGVAERQSLALLMTGDCAPRSWAAPESPQATFAALRGVLDLLLPRQFSPKIAAAETKSMVAAATVGEGRKNLFGWIGQVHPATCRQISAKSPVFAAELSLDALAKLAAAHTPRFRDLPRFPAVTRDIAVEIPRDLPASRLENAFAQAGVALLESWTLFDVFADPEGVRMAADRRSLAWSLTYRDPAKTLRSEEVDAAHEKIRQALGRVQGVVLRS